MNAVDSLPRGHKGPITFPKDHVPGMRVPKGGSSCSSCKYLGADRKSCDNRFYQKWNNNNAALGAEPDSFCSDWYEPKSGALK